MPEYRYSNSLQDWAERWEFKQPGWQLAHPNQSLVKYYGALVDGLLRLKLDANLKAGPDVCDEAIAQSTRPTRALTSPMPTPSLSADASSPTHCPLPLSSRRLRIFVPLCGKTRDLKWLRDRGDVEVVGVEWCRTIVDELFQESGFEQIEITAASGEGSADNEEGAPQIFQTPDGSLRVLRGDFYRCTTENLGGAVDAVWDRDALSAVDVVDQKRYAAHLDGLLRPGGRILMDTPLYDEAEYQGDPHPITDEDLARLFGPVLEDKDGAQEEQGEEQADTRVAQKRSQLIGSSVDSGCVMNDEDGDEAAKESDRGETKDRGVGEGAGKYEVRLLEVVDTGETWPKEYGMSYYVKRIHLLTKKN